MKSLITPVFQSLLPLIIITSCNGQNKHLQTTAEPKEAFSEESAITFGPPNIHLYEVRDGITYGLKRDASQQIGEFVRRIFQDSQGNFWFGTNKYGVCRYDGISYRYFSVSEGMAGAQITGILEDAEGNLWFSTNGGVSKYDPVADKAEETAFTSYTTKHGLSDNYVWSLFQDSRGIIWAGTNRGLCQFRGTQFLPLTASLTGAGASACGSGFTAFPLPQADVKNPQSRFSPSLVRSIMEDKNGNLWFGTDGVGVCIYDGQTFRHLTTRDGLCDNNIVCIIEDKNGNIWLSSMFGGLSRYDGHSFTNYNVENNAIRDNEVWTIYEDTSGDIWFCAEGFGVYRISGNEIDNFSKTEGLPIEAVQSIFQDRRGFYWIGGYDGLYRYDGKFFTNVTREGGC